jgi:hypothetical protein
MSSLESQASSPATSREQTEIATLRARVAELEQQLVELEAWSNRALGEAQERLYWLDRWHLDLNALMARPGAAEFRAAVRVLRSVIRFVRKTKRRLLGA